MRSSRIIGTLAVASFTAGFLTPTLMASQAAGDAPAVSAAPAGRAEPPVRESPAPESAHVPTLGVLAVGDGAVMQASECLARYGITSFDDPVSDGGALRAIAAGAAQDYAAIIVHAGHESGLVDGQIDDVLDAIGPGHRVVWVTLQIPDAAPGDYTFEERTNASIRNAVPRYLNAYVLDWNTLTSRHPEWLTDGVRPSPEGCSEYAERAARLAGLPVRERRG